jgi:hypothetical protein
VEHPEVKRVQSKLFIVAVLAVFGRGALAQTLSNTELVFASHIEGLSRPIAFEFLDSTTMLVNEKVSGRVKVIVNGVYTGIALDLPVSSNV